MLEHDARVSTLLASAEDLSTNPCCSSGRQSVSRCGAPRSLLSKDLIPQIVERLVEEVRQVIFPRGAFRSALRDALISVQSM